MLPECGEHFLDRFAAVQLSVHRVIEYKVVHAEFIDYRHISLLPVFRKTADHHSLDPHRMGHGRYIFQCKVVALAG